MRIVESLRIFDTVVETVCTEWRPAMRRDGVTEQECEHIARAFLHDGLFYNGESSWSRSPLFDYRILCSKRRVHFGSG